MLGDSKFFDMIAAKLTRRKLTVSRNTGSLVLPPQLGDRFGDSRSYIYNRSNSKRNEITYLVNGLGLTQVLISVVGHNLCVVLSDMLRGAGRPQGFEPFAFSIALIKNNAPPPPVPVVY